LDLGTINNLPKEKAFFVISMPRKYLDYYEMISDMYFFFTSISSVNRWVTNSIYENITNFNPNIIKDHGKTND